MWFNKIHMQRKESMLRRKGGHIFCVKWKKIEKDIHVYMNTSSGLILYYHTLPCAYGILRGRKSPSFHISELAFSF